MTKPTLGELAMQVAASIAHKRFRSRRDLPELVCDSQSRAWELALTAGPGATPGTVAVYAVRQVVAGRQFSQSERSVTGPNPRKRRKPARSEVNPQRLADRQGSPSSLVPFLVDFAEWRSRLTDRQREVADALAEGDRTQEAAERFGCSPGRISQLRRELEASWKGFQGL